MSYLQLLFFERIKVKKVINSLFVIVACTITTGSFAKTPLYEKFREPDLRLSTYKIDDSYYGSLSGTINVDENISIEATLDSSGYLEIGAAYGDVFLDRFYAEAYANYGRTDTTDIYTLGMFAGLPLGDNLMVFANSAYDWRRAQNRLPLLKGILDEEEWKNTVGFSYSLHKWASLSSTYNLDYLADASSPVDDKVSTSWDITITANIPWFSPYVKYSKGDYRVTPDQQRKSQDNVELGINFNF